MRILYLWLVAILFAVAVHHAYGSPNCTAQDTPTLINAELANPEFTFDFDAVPTPWDGRISINVTAGPIYLTLQGSANCNVWNSFGLGSHSWSSGSPWYPEGTGDPGYFLGLDSTSDVYCEIIFSEAVSQFSVRVASDEGADAGLFIYDESDQELNCNIFPAVTQSNDNAYSYRGFNSTTRNIKKIVIQDSYATADLLSFARCPAGFDYVDGQCMGQCADGACGANTNCTNINGTPQCSCMQYYEGNATLGCTQVTCPTSGAVVCNVHATCTDLDSEPFISCACNTGYTGPGYGQDGCAAVQAPVQAPVNVPTASPRAKTSTGVAFGLWTAATSLLMIAISI